MNKKEILNLIYDTLMNNTQHPQFDTSLVNDCEIDSDNNIINFEYAGESVELSISKWLRY